MRKIGFIGGYDKTDLVMYLARILVEIGQKVIFIDGTLTQKAKYIVPAIKPSKAYVTQFEGIDIAVGFESYDEIKDYLGMPQLADFSYDIALIDTDAVEGVRKFQIEECEQHYFATSFDMYSIKRGLESISGLNSPIDAYKVLFSKRATKEEDDYLNFVSLGSKVTWKDEIILFPFELGDQTVIYRNQRVSKIKFKKLSNQYKESLMYLALKVMEDQQYDEIRKAFKKIEKWV